MWAAAIDFKKAFDSIQHEAVWNFLGNHTISLKKLDTDQRAIVLTDVESHEFVHLNSVLQSVMEKDKKLVKTNSRASN